MFNSKSNTFIANEKENIADNLEKLNQILQIKRNFQVQKSQNSNSLSFTSLNPNELPKSY